MVSDTIMPKNQGDLKCIIRNKDGGQNENCKQHEDARVCGTEEIQIQWLHTETPKVVEGKGYSWIWVLL